MATPQEIIDKVVFGGLYEVKSGTWGGKGGFNDQAYYLAVPVMDSEGNLWMQDTYQLDRPHKTNGENISDAAIRNICGFGKGYNGYCIKRARDYYHKNQRKIINEYDLDGFELIVDLHGYRALEPWEDYRDYKQDDIVHRVILFNEHGFDWDYGTLGATLVRKAAQKDSTRMLEKVIADAYAGCGYPHGYWKIGEIDKYVELCENDGGLTEDLKNKAINVKKVNDLLCQMQKEINSLLC